MHANVDVTWYLAYQVGLASLKATTTSVHVPCNWSCIAFPIHKSIKNKSLKSGFGWISSYWLHSLYIFH